MNESQAVAHVQALKQRVKSAITEAEFQDQVVDYAHLKGWKVAHFHVAMTKAGEYHTPVAADAKGWPDLCMIRDERMVVAELKSETGRLSPEQADWIAKFSYLDASTVRTFVWQPHEWDDIVEVLK